MRFLCSLVGHTGPEVEHLSHSPVIRHEADDNGRPVDRIERVRTRRTEQTCTRCCSRVEITERDGRRWRRVHPPVTFDPSAPQWPGVGE